LIINCDKKNRVIYKYDPKICLLRVAYCRQQVELEESVLITTSSWKE